VILEKGEPLLTGPHAELYDADIGPRFVPPGESPASAVPREF
jgi:hypothetical protein